MMSSVIAILLVAMSLSVYGGARDLIPLPESVAWQPGTFTLNQETRIVQSSSADTRLADMLAADLAPATGWMLAVVSGEAGENAIRLDIDATPARQEQLGAEGYRLVVTTQGVVIEAAEDAGAFYGIQSLRQLLPTAIFSPDLTAGIAWEVPCVEIVDKPRFAWRGMMLDSSRHFKNTAAVKRFIDNMAIHKLNTFHWHLTDDHGWRIEIKKYPKLTSVGAGRTQPPIGWYAPFYSQDEIREVVAYAADRFITIVPEIEMPGHSASATAAYPELACGGNGSEVNRFVSYPMDRKGFPKAPGSNVLCAGKDSMFEFYEDVLEEVMGLFPGRYIHMGGDEVKKHFWSSCSDCRKRVADHKLKNMHELQNYVMNRFGEYLNDHGRVMVGWDEILEGDLSKESIVMSWRGTKGGIKAVKQGYDVVMSPNTHLYLNWGQSKHPGYLSHWPRHSTLENTYSLNPVPEELTPKQAAHIKGCQGNLWSEFTYSDAKLNGFIWPRGCALAEIAWTPQNQREIGDFTRRLDTHLKRLDGLGIGYWREPAETKLGVVRSGDLAKKTAKLTLPVKWPIVGDRSYICSLAPQKGLKLGGMTLVNGDLRLPGSAVPKGVAGSLMFTIPLDAPERGWLLELSVSGMLKGAPLPVTLCDAFEWRLTDPILDCRAARASTPEDDGSEWPRQHAELCKQVAQLDADMLCIGDRSLVDFEGSTWAAAPEGVVVADAGIASDKTQNVLWRVLNGAVDGGAPTQIVVSVGYANMLAGDAPEDVQSGIILIVDALHKRHPKAEIVVLGVMPSLKKTAHHYESINNAIAAVMVDRYYVRYYNANRCLLNEERLPNGDLFKTNGDLNSKGRLAVDSSLKAYGL